MAQKGRCFRAQINIHKKANPADFISKLRNFTDAILKGTPLCAPGEEGLAVQKIIDAIYRSAAQNGAEVKIS